MNNPKRRKSTFSTDQGNCVELADLGDTIGVSDSKLGDHSPILEFSRGELRAFLLGVKAGQFDDLQ